MALAFGSAFHLTRIYSEWHFLHNTLLTVLLSVVDGVFGHHSLVSDRCAATIHKLGNSQPALHTSIPLSFGPSLSFTFTFPGGGRGVHVLYPRRCHRLRRGCLFRTGRLLPNALWPNSLQRPTLSLSCTLVRKVPLENRSSSDLGVVQPYYGLERA